MKRFDSLKLFGSSAKRVLLEPNIEHLIFHQCLILSKSYEIAHRIRTNKVKKSDSIPEDIDSVLEIYDLVGNIYGQPFEKWWLKKGHHLFHDKKPLKKISLTLDLQKNTSHLLSKVSETIRLAKESNKTSGSNKITFKVNKIRPISMFYRLFLVEDICHYLKEGRNLPYWKLATEMNFPSNRVVALNKGIRNIDEANKAREYLSMLVSRKLVEAKFLSENAARGIFPSISPFSSALNFDYTSLVKIVNAQDLVEIKHMCEQQWSGKPVLQWDYASELIKGINKQRKKNKRILAKAKKITESNNPIFKLN